MTTINETDVAAFVAERARLLRANAGVKGFLALECRVLIRDPEMVVREDHTIRWCAVSESGAMTTGTTLQEAADAFVQAVSPDCLAHTKREQAAALLAEAERLEATRP